MFFSVIRCVEISSLTERTDKFRLCLFEHGIRKHIGEKEITALVLRTKKNAEVRVPSLEVNIGNNPSSLARSWFTVYASGRTTFIELAVYPVLYLCTL